MSDIKSYGEASARQMNHERDRVKRLERREETMKCLYGDRGDNREPAPRQTKDN